MRKPLSLLASALWLMGCQQRPQTLQTLGLTPEQRVPAVPCPSLAVILYHAPRDMVDAMNWSSGKLPDPTNGYDTPGTVAQIMQENAAIEAVCGKR